MALLCVEVGNRSDEGYPVLGLALRPVQLHQQSCYYYCYLCVLNQSHHYSVSGSASFKEQKGSRFEFAEEELGIQLDLLRFRRRTLLLGVLSK